MRLDALLIVGFAGAILCNSQPSIGGELAINISLKENRLKLEFRNTSEDSPLVLLDKIDPTWWVVRLKVTDSSGKLVETRKGQWDWLAFPRNCLVLKPKKTVERTINFNSADLPPGKYKMSVVYEVEKDSYFIEPWLTDRLRIDLLEKHKETMSRVWIGKAESNEIEITTPARDSPPTDKANQREKK